MFLVSLIFVSFYFLWNEIDLMQCGSHFFNRNQASIYQLINYVIEIVP